MVTQRFQFVGRTVRYLVAVLPVDLVARDRFVAIVLIQVPHRKVGILLHVDHFCILIWITWCDRLGTWYVARHVWHWLVRSDLGWITWISSVLWLFNVWNLTPVFINRDDLPIWSVRDRYI